jgi:hypothetical protein
VDRRRLFPFVVGGVLGLSAMSGVAAGFDGPPTDFQVLCLLLATVSAACAGVLTAPTAPPRIEKNRRTIQQSLPELQAIPALGGIRR